MPSSTGRVPLREGSVPGTSHPLPGQLYLLEGPLSNITTTGGQLCVVKVVIGAGVEAHNVHEIPLLISTYKIYGDSTVLSREVMLVRIHIVERSPSEWQIPWLAIQGSWVAMSTT